MNSAVKTGRSEVPPEADDPQPFRSRRRRAQRRSADRPLWLLLPSAALLLLVIVVPFLIAVYISFLALDQFSLRQWIDAPWVGLGNYVEAISASSVLHSLWVSTAFALLTTAVITPIGLLAALSVNARFRGRAVVRSLFLLPYVIPSFVTATVWRVILQADGGFNAVLGVFGIEGGQWLIGEKSFWALVMVDVWAAWPFIYIMVLAGLQNVSADLYDSADVDGASWWQKIWYVVLPQVRGQLSLGLLLSTLHHFNNFTLPFVLLGTPAPDPALTLPVNIYQTSFHVFRFGLGAAMSVLTLIIMIIPAVIYIRASRLDAKPQEV